MKFETKNIIKKYLSLKHRTLNFYVDFEKVIHHKYQISPENKDLINISDEDFNILYDYFINKIKRKVIYKKYLINRDMLDYKIFAIKDKLLI